MEKFFRRLSAFISVLLVFSLFLLTVAVPKYKKSDRKIDIFSSQSIVDNIKNLELDMTSVIYVKNSNNEWEEYHRLHGTENRIWTDIEKMPKNLQKAFIAIEDERFYTHKGVDWKRTIYALGNQLFKFSETEFGGSSITQQLIKNITSDKKRDYARKIREIARALYIEKHLSKTDILEAYLNTIALGNGICGVEVAANYYFNKSAQDLTLLECASIAAITKNPSKYNPIKSMEENKKRRNTVLSKMLELGFIEREEFEKAYDKDIKLDNTQRKDFEEEINNYFVDTLIEQVTNDLAEKYKCDEKTASSMLYNGGYKIFATMDSDIQNLLETTYNQKEKYFSEYKTVDGKREYVQSAMTILDYNGHIVGIVGGTGKKTVNRSLNRAYSVPRQPGSTMKPIGVYTLGVEKDILNYTSTVKDEPIKNYYPDGKKGPKEWFGGYKGSVPLNYALRKSMNAVPVKLLKEEIGIEESYNFLTQKLHFKYISKEDKNLSSLALGGCHRGITPTESASAFSIFGNGGVYHKPTTYYKIERTSGEVVLEHNENGEQVISSATATIMNHLLQEVVYQSEGTGRTVAGYNYKMKAYAKTGTTSDTKDAWLAGGTPYYVGSVWYGFDHNHKVSNAGMAKTIWRDIMKEIHKDLETKEFKDSEDVYKKGVGYYKNGTEPEKIIYSNSAESKPETSSSATESTVSGSETQNTGSDQSSSKPEPETPSADPTTPVESSKPSAEAT